MSRHWSLPTLPPRSRELLAFALCLILGSTLGVLVLPQEPEAVPEEKLEVFVLQQKLAPGEAARQQATDLIHEFMNGRFMLYLPDGSYEVLPLGELGLEFNEERLLKQLLDLQDPLSDTRRQLSQRGATEVELPLALEIDPAQTQDALLGLKDLLDQTPKDARVDFQTKEIRAHRRGRSLDIFATAEAIAQALTRGEKKAEAQFAFKEPERLAKELQGLKFEHVLGHFSTTYSEARKAEDRTYNLELAASRLDGTVLLPGQVFDFNEVVGPRDEANGYRVATVIADGELVDGIGGGTCQISGTLHGAAFFAGLEIVERYPHTRPSSYIKMGMDATVVYPTINFRLKNAFDFPVVLHEVVRNGKVEAHVLGPDLDQVVTLIRKIDQALPYEEEERPDPRLPKGQRILAQRGIPGFRLHRYRITRRGSHTVREKWRDLYPPTPQLVRIGTGPITLEGRGSYGGPEYLADELLVMTQRRPTAGAPPEIVENREPGKYGKYGWSEEAGMPYFKD